MSEQTERDDTILGTALSRAIESQHPRETPYERSRLAARLAEPRRSAFWPALAAAATFLAAVGLAAFVLVPRGAPAEPNPSAPVVVPTNTPAATSGPATPYRVFYARDGLPPLAAMVTMGPGTKPEERIQYRVEALLQRSPGQTAPSGAVNPAASIRTRIVTTGSVSAVQEPVHVAITGDLATVEFDISDWGVRGAAQSQALVQQLVYTITEEPGIRRAQIAEKGKPNAIIDQLLIDKPLTREDVAGYSFKGTDVPSIENPGTDAQQEITRWFVSNGILTNRTVGIAGRLSVDVQEARPPCESGTCPRERLDPKFTAKLDLAPKDSAGKARITLYVPAIGLPEAQPIYQDFVGGPILAVDGQVVRGDAPMVVITLYLDDARPWRASIEPLDNGVTRINVDVGGRPSLVNKNVAVYGIEPGSPVGHNVTIVGTARVFEASVAWRLKDARGVEVAVGHTTASIGTSPVWGTFTTRVDVPAGVSGNVTLEVFHASPQDGSDQDLVEIPLTIR